MPTETKCEQKNCGFHTLDELYRHRNTLFLGLMTHEVSWISKVHGDGTSYDGWFLAGIVLPQTGMAQLSDLSMPFDDMSDVGKGYTTVTYHLPMAMWDAAVGTGANVLEKAPQWDGHTQEDVLARLDVFIGLR